MWFNSIRSWLRNTFGSCHDRWRHAWTYHGEERRQCDVCKVKEVQIGWYSFMDADPIRQWGRESDNGQQA